MADDSKERLPEQSELPKITKITAGVKDPNRANIFLDGRFSFSLDVAQVIDLNIKIGQQVDERRLEELQEASEFGKLYQRTLEWALARPRSVQETNNYLYQRKRRRIILNQQRARDGKKPIPEFKDATIVLVIQRLNEKGYIDDLKFARYFAEHRHLRKGISRRRLQMELKQKGIREDLIQRVLGETERVDDEEILKIVRKKRKKYDDTKLLSYLVGQGFDFQKSKAVIDGYSPDEDSPFS